MFGYLASSLPHSCVLVDVGKNASASHSCTNIHLPALLFSSLQRPRAHKSPPPSHWLDRRTTPSKYVTTSTMLSENQPCSCAHGVCLPFANVQLPCVVVRAPALSTVASRVVAVVVAALVYLGFLRINLTVRKPVKVDPPASHPTTRRWKRSFMFQCHRPKSRY